jgi:hypothetical protein
MHGSLQKCDALIVTAPVGILLEVSLDSEDNHCVIQI